MENNKLPDDMVSADELLAFVKKNKIDRRIIDNAINKHERAKSSQNNFYQMTVYDVDGVCIINVNYSQKNNPTEISLCDASIESDLIEKIIEETQKGKITGTRIIRRLCFSTMRVENQIRYKDDFQMLPMMLGNPIHGVANPATIVAKHPFILEIKVHKANDDIYNAYYSSKALNETELLLNAITKGVVRGGEKLAKADWVYNYGLASTIQQLSYNFTFPKNLSDDEFSNNDQIPFEYLRADDEPYKQLTWGDEEFAYLKLYDELNENEKKQFQIAAYWIRHADTLNIQSGSSSYIAIVTAFESLSEVDENQDKCDACNQIKNSTARFKKTVDTLLGFNKKFTSKLYSMRSQYAHGSSLALMDIEGFFLAHQDHSGEMIILDELISRSQTALLRWLMPEVRNQLK